MKQKLLAGLVVLALAPTALAQPSDIWENWSQFIVPSAANPYAPAIDARTFLNHRGATFDLALDDYFTTSDTLYYTNQGAMLFFPGADFQTYPIDLGSPSMAASFANIGSGSGGGVINVSGTYLFNLSPGLTFGNLAGSSKLLVRATNIFNNGTINMDASSLIKFVGENIDLTRGGLSMASPTAPLIIGTNLVFNGVFNAGILDNYWAADTMTNAITPSQLRFGITPFNLVTNRQYRVFENALFLPQPVTYLNIIDNSVQNSNVLYQVVFLREADPAFANNVYFTPFEIGVQWQWTTPSWPSRAPVTNYMTLTDNFGEVTNIGVFFNGFINPQAPYPKPTYMPQNYTFFVGTPLFTGFTPASPTVLPNIFGNVQVTNQYAAYQGLFTAATQLASDTAGGNVTNLSGRIELNASKTLNLTGARISSLNYLLLNATNQFLGSGNAVIESPNVDMYLRVTNGTLSVTNLLVPFQTHPSGTCDLWSGRWTNVVNNITNAYHVLFVDSVLRPTSPPLVQTLNLNVTNFTGVPTNNLLISDTFNVSSNLLLSAERITLQTNDVTAFNAFGQIIFYNPNITWSTATPRLQYLTNWGGLTMQNAVYFGGSRTQPPYNTNLVDIPYAAMVNHGGITNQASLIWANYFENSGTFDAGNGSFVLQKATSGSLLTNGLIYAPNGDVSFAASSLFISNHAIVAGGALTFDLGSLLDDGSYTTNTADYITNKNFWIVGNGINLPSQVAHASLLGTTITNVAGDYELVVNNWSAADKGNAPAGFTDNAAIGHLILTGRTNCTFEFRGTGSANAMYVDYLDLRGFVATNADQFGNFLSLTCAPNMKVYFGQATADGVSVAEKLPLVNDGRFLWVSNYNTGFFSSTNVVYPDGTTNRLNAALVASCEIDSNGNGIPNCQDPAPVPILTPMGLGLSVTTTNRPSPATLVSWTAFPLTTNALLWAPVANGTNWQVLTNFLYTGSMPNRVTVTDLIKTNAPRFYRVRVGTP